MSGGRFSIEAQFKATDGFSGPVGKMGRAVSKMADMGNASVHQLSSGVDKALGAAAIGAGAVAGAALFHVGKAGADFEQAITNVGAVMGKTRGQIGDLEKEAMRLGVVTQFSSSEVADGMEMMARKGFDSKEILAGIPGVLNAVAASGEGMAEVTTVVGSAIRGFGLDAADTSKVANILAFTAEKTGARITEMGEALSIAAPTAKTLGVSIEDTATAVGLLQKMGIDASTSGSAVATMLAKISKPSKDAAEQMANLGIKFTNAKGDMLPFRDVLGQFVKAGDKTSGNMKRMAFFAELVGLRGDKAALGLSDMAKSGDFDKLADGVHHVGDYAEKVAKIRMDTTEGSWKLLTSTVEVLETKLFNLKGGAIRGVIDQTNAWVAANQELIVQKVQDTIESVSNNMGKIVMWAERIAKIGAVFMGLAVAIKVVAAAQAIWNAAMAANPITLWILAITVAVALLWAFWPEVSAFFVKLWGGIKDLAGRIATSVGSVFSAVWEPVKAFAKGAFEFIVGLIVLSFMPLMPILRPIFDALGEVASWVMDHWAPVGAFFARLWEGAKVTFTAFGSFVVASATALIAKVQELWAPVGTFFSSLWDGIAAAFHSVLGAIIDKIGIAVDYVRKIGRHALGNDTPEPAPAVPPGPGAPGEESASPAPPADRAAQANQDAGAGSYGEGVVTIRDGTGRAEVTRAPTRGFRMPLVPASGTP